MFHKYSKHNSKFVSKKWLKLKRHLACCSKRFISYFGPVLLRHTTEIVARHSFVLSRRYARVFGQASSSLFKLTPNECASDPLTKDIITEEDRSAAESRADNHNACLCEVVAEQDSSPSLLHMNQKRINSLYWSRILRLFDSHGLQPLWIYLLDRWSHTSSAWVRWVRI